jgi:hypothetical protein
MNFKSHKRSWLAGLQKHEMNRLERIGFFLTSEIQKTVNKKGAGKLYKVKGDVGYILHRASIPGQYPARLFGKLGQAIAHKEDKANLSTKIGVFRESAASAYARRLELGFVGNDSRGRFYRQKARPFLRPALYIHKNRINAMLKT